MSLKNSKDKARHNIFLAVGEHYTEHSEGGEEYHKDITEALDWFVSDLGGDIIQAIADDLPNHKISSWSAIGAAGVRTTIMGIIESFTGHLPDLPPPCKCVGFPDMDGEKGADEDDEGVPVKEEIERNFYGR